MADYTKATDFESKDSLPTGNPLKIVKGTELDDEFDAIAIAIATKADIHEETHTGLHTFTANVNVTGTLTAGLIDGGDYGI
jgi:hypothetical protein